MVDLEQIVLRGRLVLGLLVTAPADDHELRAALEETARRLDMSIELEEGSFEGK